MQKPAPGPEPRKAAVAFIFTIVLLDVIALGIIIPVLPKLVESMVGETPRGAEIFGLGAHAVLVLAAARRPVRPVRAAAGVVDFDGRTWSRLHLDGAGT